MTHREKFVAFAMSQVGQTVLWGGRGDMVFDSGLRCLRPTGYAQPVFDCSGLITTALAFVGAPDMRGTHNAQLLCDATPVNTAFTPQAGDFGFYGNGPDSVIHIVMTLADGAVLSADGATRRITLLDVAKKAGARVRVHDVQRYRSEPWFSVHRNTFVDALDKVC